MKWLINILIIISLVSCGDGSNNNESPTDLTSDPDDNNDLAFTVFEGQSVNIDTTLGFTNIQWQQISGPEILIDDINASSVIATIPWVDQPDLIAEFIISGEVDGVAQQAPVSIPILNRYFYKLHVLNETTGATDLYIDYLASTPTSGVFEEGMIQLTNLPSNTEVCGSRVSPTGRYIAYALNTGEGSAIFPICRGVHIVDIATNEIQNPSVLGTDNNDIAINNLQWSPDESKLSYIGDHGQGIDQHYVITFDINNNSATTSYLNYHNNVEASHWPEDILFPIVDGSHPYNITDIEDTQTSSPAWSGNSHSLSFSIFDNEDGERYLEQSSIYGDARRLETPQFGWDILTVVDPELANHSFNGECTTIDCNIVVPPPTDYIISWPSLSPLRNANRIGSSTQGHLAFTASVFIDETQAIRVLAVRPPVNPGEATGINNVSHIEALSIDIDAARWSPTAPDLAFAAASEYRFRYSEEIGYGTPVDAVYPNINDGIISPEIPGQLYFYENYQRFHSEAQERLSYPQPSIDDNDVRHLEWSADGQAIAYVRGEENTEGAYYTSLWVTAIDEVRDESNTTIDSNTQLLLNLRGTGDYFSDYLWSPDGSGVLVVMQTEAGTVLQFISADGTNTTNFAVDDDSFENLYSIALSFSPDGEYFAYTTSQLIGGSFIPTLYIQSVAGSAPVQANVEFSAGASIRNFQWAPAGQILAYLARAGSGQDRELYLANTNGESQSWNAFLSADQRIDAFTVDHYQSLIQINF